MIKKLRPTCFISYCRDNADTESIEHFVQALKQTSKNQIDFLFDEELLPGDDLQKFMESLQCADGVILLLTPEYKAKVQNRSGVVYTEYKQIIDRYLEQQGDANNSSELNLEGKLEGLKSPFCLIPVIFSGTYATSCPDELNRPVAVDFTQYRAQRSRGELFVASSTQRKHENKLSKIVSQLITRYSSKRESVAKSFNDLLYSLFHTTKHEHVCGDPKFQSELEHVFVKTHPYNKVNQQTSYLLIGRKGSGKSTLVDYIGRNSEERYKAAIKIDVDNFDLEYIFTVLTPRQVHADLDVVVPLVKVFEIVWELFLMLCCIDTLVSEGEQGRLKQSQMQHTPLLDRLLKTVTGQVGEATVKIDYRALFHWAYAKIIVQIEKAIENSRNDPAHFAYDVSARLDPQEMQRVAISEAVMASFNSVLAHCSKRFLVSLDGFDTAFEKFRLRTQQVVKEPDDRRRRTQFEVDWLSGFVHVAIEMKSASRRAPMSSMVDFCVTIPKDRYVEIRDSERDGYMYIGKCYEIRWSAIELAILLFKRLEILDIGSFRSVKSDPSHKRLESVLKTAYPYIPVDTITTLDGSEHEMPLFIDVLRHTFWRPREILIYFAKIIAVLRDIKRRNIEITPFTVGKCISDTTREIIRTEFLNEFQRHCTNLKMIIELFRRKKQILSRQELDEIIGGYRFNFVDRDSPVTDFKTQVQFLYEIGFVGLEASRKVVERLKLLHTDIFCFNAGDEPFEVLMLEDFLDCKFIIHPLFCEYLDLDVKGQRLTLKFDWKYLQEQESHVILPS